MSASATSTRPIPSSVSSRLSALRLQIVGWFLVDGLGKVLLLALGLGAVDLALDWLFRMDVSQRAIMLALMLGGIAVMFYWRLIRPFSQMPTDDALCLSVEDKHKELGQSLISAVQFSRDEGFEARGVSQKLVSATIESGIQAAGRINFSDVLDSGRFALNVFLLVAAVGLVTLVGVGVFATEPLRIWFDRNIMLGESVWPQRTYLVVQNVKDGKIRVPRGENWLQTVIATDKSVEIPEAVFIDFRPSRGRPSQKTKKHATDPSYELTFNNVIEEFQFRARGNDATTPWIKVELVEQPAVQELNLEVTSPKYAGGKTDALPTGKGPYYVLKGSSMRLSGEANKPLSAADLSIEGKSYPLKLDGKSKFTVDLTGADLIAGTYVINLTDDEGLASKRPTTFGLRIRPDREPRVRSKLVGISSMVVPQAMIPMSSRVSDDYAVVAVRLAFSWRGEEGDAEPKAGVLQFDQLVSKLPGDDISFDDIFDLPPQMIPSGSTLSFRLEADDNDDISGPNTGRSPEFLVKVVTEEQLRTDLLRREKEQRQEFERLLKSQEDIVTETRALAATVAGEKDLTEEQKLLIMGLQRRQKVVGTNTGTIASRLTEFLVEVHNNRLEEEGGPLERRLGEKIIVPMTEVAGEGVPESMRRLDKTRRLAGAVAERDPALVEAVEQQEALAAKMREILVHMVKAEGYQEAVNLLYEIEKSQKGVYDLTEKEKQERIKKIFEQGGNLPEKKPEDEKKPDEAKKPDDK